MRKVGGSPGHVRQYLHNDTNSIIHLKMEADLNDQHVHIAKKHLEQIRAAKIKVRGHLLWPTMVGTHELNWLNTLRI